MNRSVATIIGPGVLRRQSAPACSSHASRPGSKTLRIVLACLALATLLSCAIAGKPVGGLSHPDGTVITDNDVAIPMRDGTMLRADVYRPGESGRYPVLLYRTPYGKHQTADSYDTHLRAVARGYVVVLQDVRGRYASEGLFDPYRNEGRDGYDTIEWAAAQPWSNGQVGTFGLSYPGAVQWLAAIESPPHLKAMAPAMTFSSPRNFFYMNGMFDLSWLPWIYLYIAPDSRLRLGLPGITSDQEARQEWSVVAEEYLSHLPLAELPYLREEAPFYFEWLKHPPHDPWWSWAEIRGRYPDVDAAVLNLSGWYDDSYGTEGAATNHNGLVRSRTGEAAPRSHLVLGPWTHGVQETGVTRLGDLDFGADAGIDYDETILRFFDQYLKGTDTGLEAEKPVRYFIMGANEWRTSNTWPPQEAGSQTLCLTRQTGTGEGGLGSCNESSGLPGSSFTANPLDPVIDAYYSAGPHDYAELRKRDDLLTFESRELETNVTVAGNATGRVFVSCTCKDFDLWVTLLDVHPDGRAYNLMSPGANALRVSYRDATGPRQPVQPGKVYELNLGGLMTGNEFSAGHRIRVHISASFAPHLSRNLQTGESERYSSVSEPATITVHHSDEFPSALILPVLEAQH